MQEPCFIFHTLSLKARRGYLMIKRSFYMKFERVDETIKYSASDVNRKCSWLQFVKWMMWWKITNYRRQSLSLCFKINFVYEAVTFVTTNYQYLNCVCLWFVVVIIICWYHNIVFVLSKLSSVQMESTCRLLYTK